MQSIINTHEIFIFFYWEIGERSAIRTGRAKANIGEKLTIYSTENKHKAIQGIHEWLGGGIKSEAMHSIAEGLHTTEKRQ